MPEVLLLNGPVFGTKTEAADLFAGSGVAEGMA
jgi:hypothetical protein